MDILLHGAAGIGDDIRTGGHAGMDADGCCRLCLNAWQFGKETTHPLTALQFHDVLLLKGLPFAMLGDIILSVHSVRSFAECVCGESILKGEMQNEACSSRF